MIEPCAFCGEPSTKLCDFMLGFEIQKFRQTAPQVAFNDGRFDEFVPGKGLPVFSCDNSNEMFTCDAPMCDKCSKQVGMQTMSGDGICEVDTIDHCPIHAEHTNDKRAMFISRLNAEMERRKWQFKIVDELSE